MDHLPSLEERQWLVNALTTLIAKRGGEMLDGAPLVEPTNEWFPEKWSATARHGHRLAQRLLHYAGLGALRPTLNAFEPEADVDGSMPWDAGTAGWFAGIEGRRAHFGLHVGQFSDPEAAAGVLAHEVAHAWRAHHHLMVEDRDEEELLTDLTTVALGFGILSTNNTDRYRSSGTHDTTTWSVSSVGYLPPQAMAYLLALWTTARGRTGERKRIERHLEPNQLGFFRDALEDLHDSDKTPRELLGVRSASSVRPLLRPRDFTPDEPAEDELEEPEYEEAAESNRGQLVYRKAKGESLLHFVMGAIVGFLAGGFIGLAVLGENEIARVGMLAATCAAIFATFMVYRSRGDVCSECETRIDGEVAVCAGCGGSVGRRVTTRELKRLREEELDRARHAMSSTKIVPPASRSVRARDIRPASELVAAQAACSEENDAHRFDCSSL
jgi:hypothetical protein